MKATPLAYGKTYHIYNCGVNGCDLFVEKNDYNHFLRLYDTHISPVADTFAWCLMKNHFHLLVQIKNEHEILPFSKSFIKKKFSDLKPTSVTTAEVTFDTLSAVEAGDPNSGEKPTPNPQKKPNPSLQFSHLFNAYAQYFNNRHKRSGILFERAFQRKIVDNQSYFKNLIYYIHHNPIKHGFVEHILEYPWTSYLSMISMKPTKLLRDVVLGYFNDEADFVTFHQQQHDMSKMSDYLLEENLFEEMPFSSQTPLSGSATTDRVFEENPDKNINK